MEVARPRVVIVGLGPAGVDWVLPGALRELEQADVRFARTARHPAVEELARAGMQFESFDAEYDTAPDLDAVYAAIVQRLLAAGDAVYAVPGNPAVAERTVALLRDAASRGDVDLRIVPGLSFAELGWARLGVDPAVTDVRVADARDLRLEPASGAGPLLVVQCDSALVLSDVKLTLLEVLDPGAPVTVLRRLGLGDEEVRTVSLADLDRAVVPDHLTALFVPGEAATAAVVELRRLLALAERLRRPGGCPWDAEQTHHSVTRYLLEEAYEVVEAVERLPAGAPVGACPPTAYAALADELGDLLYQVIFHAVLAQEAGAFTMADVARGIRDKLVRRHPHVFGDVVATTSSEVMSNWEQIKKDEKGAASIVEGVTPALPSLLFTHKLLRKAASVGLDPGSSADALERLDAAMVSLHSADGADVEGPLGDLLAAAVMLARAAGIDAESVLRGWAADFRDRFRAMETAAAARGLDLTTLDPEAVAALWADLEPRQP